MGIAKKIKDIKKDFLKINPRRCKSFDINCWSCQGWMAYDILLDQFLMSDKVDEIDKEEIIKQEKTMQMPHLPSIQIELGDVFFLLPSVDFGWKSQYKYFEFDWLYLHISIWM